MPSVESLKKIASLVVGVVIFVGLIAIYNVIDPVAHIPSLENQYWGGYYDTKLFGRVWCLAKFYQRDENLRMLLLSVDDTKDVFDVDRSSNSQNFVELDMNDLDSDIRIHAKQLYDGKRYVMERLMARRFHDFWKRNDDISIRGQDVTLKAAFAIEPLKKEHVLDFYNEYVLREKRYHSVEEIDALIEAAKR